MVVWAYDIEVDVVGHPFRLAAWLPLRVCRSGIRDSGFNTLPWPREQSLCTRARG
jgi:hypothetical protein